MDEFRKIRLAYPPVLMIIAFALAAGIDPRFDLNEWLCDVSNNGTFVSLGIAFVVGSMLPVGFAIGTLVVFILRIMALMPRVPNYECPVSREELRKLWEDHLEGKSGDFSRDYDTVVCASFVHGLLLEGQKSWIDRRWK